MIYQIAAFLARLISLYSFLIWLRIILSWFSPYPREGSLTWYFSKIIDPYLNLFRSRKFVIGYIDFSPLFAIAVLSVAQSLLTIFASFGTLRLSLVLMVLLNAFWSYGLQLFLMILIIMLVIRLIGTLTHNPGFSRISMITESLIRKVQAPFFPRRIVKESTLAVIALIIAVLAYFACRYVIALLMNLSLRIPF